MTPRHPRTVAEPIRRRVLGAAADAWLLVPRTPLAQRERRRLGYLSVTPFVAHRWRANPVPTRYELALNLGTARAIGVTVPHAVLMQAEWVVE